MKIFPVAFFLLAISFTGISQDKKEEGKPKPEDKPPAKEEKESGFKDKVSVTKHKGTFGGVAMDYTATAGTMVIKKDEKDPEAAIFYTAYIKDGVEDPAKRPLVFCFNGGPGSASVWLHLGGFGPKRVQMNPDGTMPPPPFSLGPNPESLLGAADLVFVDPVTTGFSRTKKPEDAKAFHSFEGDLDSVAEFIRLYTTRNERWLSPKFLAGESYGAFRVAGLSEVLHQKYGFYLNGIVLVSGVLSFDTLWGSDLADICILPALSEVAAWHDKLEGDLADNNERRRSEVEAFARGEYASALLQGAKLDPAKKSELAKKISGYIGLDADLIERMNLRVDSTRFREELLRDSGEIIGRFDARIKGRDADLAGTSPWFDPSYSAVYGPFAATLKDYLRRELKFESDRTYEILTSKVRPWDYSKAFVGQPVDVTPKLASALSENPYLKIMVNCGYQDLATPYTGITHSLDHLEIAPEFRDNISYTFYEGGHMMYTIEKSNALWNKDVADFVRENSNIENAE